MAVLTKKELQIILLDMRFYASQSKPLNESPVHIQLREKIEDMIEKYCDHEFYVIGCGGAAYAKCCKCGETPRTFE